MSERLEPETALLWKVVLVVLLALGIGLALFDATRLADADAHCGCGAKNCAMPCTSCCDPGTCTVTKDPTTGRKPR